jgi:hypothetical protein
MGRKRIEDEDDDRAPSMGDAGAPGTRTNRTRTETVDHAAMTRAIKDAFEAGGAAARGIIDAQARALTEAYAEIAAGHRLAAASVEKSQELVGRLQQVASQNVSLTLAEQNGRAQVADIQEKGLSLRHGMTTLATNPYLGLVLERVLPGLNIKPPRPPGPGNTPLEAVQRLAASLRSGSEGSKILLDVLAQFCAEELDRPGDVGLLIEFVNEAAMKELDEAVAAE